VNARALELTRVAIWVLLATSAACTTMPDGAVETGPPPRSSRNPWVDDRYGPRATVVPVPAGIPPESLRWAVEAALSERHWTVNRSTPGQIEAFVQSNGTRENATIRVTYGPAEIQIKQLVAAVSPQRYDRWVRLLVLNINNRLAQTGRAAAPAAAPPPAAASPPVAEPEDP
jgi:hypothetical protein